eukprot:744898-Pelagomonas_calceolata.AAC.3
MGNACAFNFANSKQHKRTEFHYARLVLKPGENEHYSDNDLVLLSKENPMVCRGNRAVCVCVCCSAAAAAVAAGRSTSLCLNATNGRLPGGRPPTAPERTHAPQYDLIICGAQDEEDNDGRSSAGRQVSALGFCEGREGEQSVRVKFLLTDESQLSSPSSLSRGLQGLQKRLEPDSLADGGGKDCQLQL